VKIKKIKGINHHFAAYMYSGAIITALGTPFYINGRTRLSENWFPKEKSAVA
jgi:hypothetical protein